MFIIMLILAVIIFILVITNIVVVQQSRAYVIERLGGPMSLNAWAPFTVSGA